MFKILRIVLAVLFLILSGSLLWYQIDKDRIEHRMRLHCEKEISLLLSRPVKIKELTLIPFSVVLNKITIFDADTRKPAASIGSVTVSPQWVPLIIERKLNVKMDVRDFSTEKASASLLLKVKAGKAKNLKELSDFSLVEDISVLRGTFKWGKYEFTGTRGEIKLKDFNITKGNLFFNLSEMDFSLEFLGVPAEATDYSVVVKTGEMVLTGIFSPNKNNLIIDRLYGALFSLEMDLNGKIENISSENDKIFELEGTVRGDAGKTIQYFENRIPFKNVPDVEGLFESHFSFSVKESSLADISLRAKTETKNLLIDKIKIRDLSAELIVENRKISVPDSSFMLFDSKTAVNFFMDMAEKGFPLNLDIRTLNMDIDSFNGAHQKEIYGPLDIEFSFKGYGEDLFLMTKTLDAEKDITDLDLKRIFRNDIPFSEFEKYLKRIEIYVLCNLKSLEITDMELGDIVVEASLKDGKVDLSKLEFNAFKGKITASCQGDLLDEKFPLLFNAIMTGIDSREACQKFFNTQNNVEGELDLDLTFKGNTWDLIDLLERIKQKPGNYYTFFVNENHLTRMELKAVGSVQKIYTKKIVLDDMFFDVSLNEGILNVNSLNFRSFDGETRSSGTIELMNERLPVTLKTNVDGINTKLLFNNMALDENGTQEVLSFDLDYSGYYGDLVELGEFLKDKTSDKNVTLIEKINSVHFFFIHKRNIKEHKVHAAFGFKSLKLGKVEFNDLKGGLSLNDGILNISPLSAGFYDGQFSFDLLSDAGSEMVPFTLNFSAKNVDFKKLTQAVGSGKNKVYGKLDCEFYLKGKAEDEKTITGNGNMMISNADLGPMPILTPLLGNIYSALQVFPAFEKIKITSAAATFDIKDRKIMTSDLEFCGGELDVIAEGYMDFDGKLNVAFENRLILPDSDEDESWQVAIRNFVTSFGKVISKAHLKGTVKEPKWEFEYVDQIKNNIGKNISAFFKNLGK